MGLLGADVTRQCEAMGASHQVICLQAAGKSVLQLAGAGRFADLVEPGHEACWNHFMQQRFCRSLLQGSASTWTACCVQSWHQVHIAYMQVRVPHQHQAGCIPSCPSSSMAPPTTGSRAAVGQAIMSQTASHACPKLRRVSQSHAAGEQHSRAKGARTHETAQAGSTWQVQEALTVMMGKGELRCGALSRMCFRSCTGQQVSGHRRNTLMRMQQLHVRHHRLDSGAAE